MSSRRLVLAVSAAVSAAVALSSAAGADDQPAPLKFAWPVPSKATVTERIDMKGRQAKTRYTVTLEAVGTDGTFRARVSDFEFIELGGRPASDPALAQQISQALTLAKLIPDLLITPEGRVKDVVGLEAAIEAQLVLIEQSGDALRKAELPALRAMLSRPETLEAQKRKTARLWQSWVGEWVGRTIPADKTVESKHAVRCPDGVEREAPTTLRRTESSDGPGTGQFKRESVLDGEDAKPAIESWVKKMNDLTGRPAPDIVGMRIYERAVVSTELATLRPRRVFTEEIRTLRVKDQPDAVDTERHEFTFEWPAAETPKPAPTDK